MAIEAIGLDQIHDNPYQARLTYHKKDIDDLAHSIKTHGLLQVPPGRRVDGKVELGFGHLRKRAFAKLAKKEPEKWGNMPIDIRELSDDQMAMFALEENLKRREITLLETARAVDHYLNSFLAKTEVELAESLNMSKGTVSNMRRVLRLPELFLEKIDAGLITFTQGRELLTLEGIPDSKELMSSALAGINTTGNKSYSKPNTVEGLQQSIHSTINGHFPPLDKEWGGWHWDLLFDTRAAGCLQCGKCITTHPTKSQSAHYCTNEVCWKQKTEEHKTIAAAAAKARMQAEVLERAVQDVAQRTPELDRPRYTLEKRGTSWIALDSQGVVIAIDTTKEMADAWVVAYFLPVTTKINPDYAEYVLNHTYRFMEKPGSRKLEYFDVTAPDLATAAKALGVDVENVEQVKVWKSSGKLGTGGGVSAGWSKCTESLVDLAQVEEPPDEICATEEELRQMEREATEKEDLSRRIATAPAPTPQEVPEDNLSLAREKAGTRAELLDLNDICSGSESWNRQMKQGYALLSGELRHIDELDECLERCTHGFHYAFDSKHPTEKEIFVCSDTKCLSNKKSAFTRAKNAEGQARKKAETKAVKEAIDLVGQVTRDGKQLLNEEGKFSNTVVVPRATLKLILLAQMDGRHTQRSYYGGGDGKNPETWLWERLSAGTPAIERKREDLFKRIDKLSDEELAKLVVEFMFYYLVDHGDIGTYEIKATEPLKWMGIDIKMEAG